MRKKLLHLVWMAVALAACSKKSNGGNGTGNEPPVDTTPVKTVTMWLTNADQSSLLQKQSSLLGFGTANASFGTVSLDSTIGFQSIDGFGYTLTGGSAQLINALPEAKQSALLQEMFGSAESSIAVSYIRISIGASDLDATVFSYDDLPAGQTDPTLSKFDLGKDREALIPVLKKILAINPSIKILGSPWSAPVWMKDNNSSIGGSLKTEYYSVYANYFVKYIQAMKAEGITIDAVTIQNEPQHGGNNPSMVMSATQQAEFIKNNLGPAFQSATLNTKIIVWDHNCDNPGYPKTVLADAGAYKYINGSAFHLYAGDISALTDVHNAFPDKAVYFTEQWTSSEGQFAGDLQWHTKNVIIGSMRNWSRVALEWNLGNNATFGPHTDGGCTQCKGALTITGADYTRNVSYYIIAHASKFVTPGSVHINSNGPSTLPNVAFLRPDGKKVLIVLNDSSGDLGFNIQFKGKSAFSQLKAGSVATYIW